MNTATTKKSSIIRYVSAVAFVVAGILLVLYPLLRPFSDETSLQGAHAFASPLWLLAHLLAVVGFILTTLGLLGLSRVLQNTGVERLMSLALIMTWIGVGLILPYYGAEVFALNVIGQEVVRQQNLALMPLVNAIRFGPAVYVFAVGLLFLAIGPILAAIAIWRSGVVFKWSGIPFALGFALYLPQFFGDQPIRVLHGLLLTLGCIWLAVSLVRAQKSHEQKHLTGQVANQPIG
ncbi:hypothetical protein [Tengunoibacter tsumagoiensis]|uniref:DUF4386 domain-containing protein n=1 Tax=Tengunoibacter tsumagoiensis TaxID=2014871 RepID=A0A402A0Z1_9CHLR|nr:hypothetical protein [Tengunoibacter tsumagoiensis]GCE12726.1 hypothetical protein KTT_25850 [Tengunoibacter tsumagoiensis]